MVRGIVGTLIDVGRGKLNPEDMVSILEKHRLFSFFLFTRINTHT